MADTFRMNIREELRRRDFRGWLVGVMLANLDDRELSIARSMTNTPAEVRLTIDGGAVDFEKVMERIADAVADYGHAEAKRQMGMAAAEPYHDLIERLSELHMCTQQKLAELFPELKQE